MQVVPSNFSFPSNQNYIQKRAYFNSINIIPPLKQKEINSSQPIFISFAGNNTLTNCIHNANKQPMKFSKYLNPILNNNIQNISIPNTNYNQPIGKCFKIRSKETDDNKKRITKERNKLAAKRWRKKKDLYLKKLDDENFVLRQQVLSMYNKFKQLKCENNFLNDELQYFFRSTIESILIKNNSINIQRKIGFHISELLKFNSK